jgi:superfamily II DNA/RNA helicase
MNSYNLTGLLPEIVSALEDVGLQSPTSLQAKTIPFLLKTNRDLFAIAPRGAGKTAAYGLPLLQIVDPAIRQTQGLIICASRDASLKITGELKKYARNLPAVRIFAFNDKVDIELQAENLTKETQIVAATPDRCLELVRRGDMDLSQVKWFIVDGADELLEQNFVRQLDEIIAGLPGTDRILTFAETKTNAVNEFVIDHMPETETLVVQSQKKKAPATPQPPKSPSRQEPPKNAATPQPPKSPDHQESEKSTATPEPPKAPAAKKATSTKDLPVNPEINHSFCLVPPRQRYFYLIELLKGPGDLHAVVFCRTKKRVHELAGKLREDGFEAMGIDIDTSAEEAAEILKKFHNREVPVLVVNDYPDSDSAIEGLTHLIHFNPPTSAGMYARRMGLLGTKAGSSVLLLLDGEAPRLPNLEERIGQKIAELSLNVQLPPSKKTAKKPKRDGKDKSPKKDKSPNRDKPQSDKSSNKKNSRDRGDDRSKNQSRNESDSGDEDRSRNQSRRGDDNRSRNRSRQGDEGRGRNQNRREDDDRSRNQSRRGDDDRRRRDSQALPRRMERVHESEIIDGPPVSSKPQRLSSKDLATVIEAVKKIDPTNAGLEREWSTVYKKLEHLTWEEVIRHFVAYIVESDVVQDMDEKEEAPEPTGIKALFRLWGKK